MAKNVLIKKPNPAASKGYDEIHPITKAGNVFTTSGSSLEDMTASRDGYGTTTNSGNVYSVVISPGTGALIEGLRVMVKINTNSTGAASLNYNNLGAKAIKKPNGNNATNLKAGSVYTLVYSGSAFILQGEGGEGDAVSGDIRAGRTAENDLGPVTGSLPVRSGGIVTPGASAIVKDAGIYDDPITVAAVSVPADRLLTGNTVAGTAGTMPNRGAVTITPSALAQTILAGYHNGLGVVAAVTFNSAKLLSDTTIAGTKGTMVDNGAINITPSAAAQTIAAGYHNGSGKVAAVTVPTNKVLNDTTIAGTKGTLPIRANDQPNNPFWTDGNGNMSVGFATGGYVNDSGFGAGIASVGISSAAFLPYNVRVGVPLGNIVGTLQPRAFASGTYNRQGGMLVTISGLSFRPKVIILWDTASTDPFSPMGCYNEAISTTKYRGNQNITLSLGADGSYISDSGFALYMGNNTNSWVACG